MKILFLQIIFLLVAFSSQANVIQWHSSSVSLLRGQDFELGEQERTILTLEHANGWKYGDFFAFVDLTYRDDGIKDSYGEISPRLSLSKITGKDLSYSFLKDYLLTFTFEKNENSSKTYLGGVAVDLNLPYFDYFQTNYYYRDDPDVDGETYQVTLVWGLPINVAKQKFVFKGFADIDGGEGSEVQNELVSADLLWDIGHAFGAKAGRFYTGVEYQYWHNKFGIEGVDESLAQVKIKYSF